MEKLLQKRYRVNDKREEIERLIRDGIDKRDIDIKIQLIQGLIPIGLMYVKEVLEEEVKMLAGDRYKRNGNRSYDRWGHQGGSVYIGRQKVGIRYTRVRDKLKNEEIGLESYKRLQDKHQINDEVLRKVLQGISCRRYEDSSAMVPEVFGLSASSISRGFIKASSEKLREIRERSLKELDIVAIIIDGKVFKDDMMIIALGITIEGEKKILGFIESGSENSVVIRDFLNELIERGLKTEEGILFVIDGSKGIRRGIEEVLGDKCLVQRCQWHKRSNVLSYLPKDREEIIKNKLQNAYEKESYEEAKKSLKSVGKELMLINESAAKSLEEGLEETLTLHKIGLFKEMSKSLKTTNCIESLMSLIGQKVDKVDRWRNSNQKQRWLAAAILDAEPRLNKIRGYKYLYEMRRRITAIINKDKNELKAA